MKTTTMKTWGEWCVTTVATTILAAVMLVALYGFYSTVRTWKMAVNSEHAKLYKWNGEYYQSYTISYSHGRTWNEKGEWINLWKWPSFHHVNTKNLIDKQLQPKPETPAGP